MLRYLARRGPSVAMNAFKQPLRNFARPGYLKGGSNPVVKPSKEVANSNGIPSGRYSNELNPNYMQAVQDKRNRRYRIAGVITVGLVTFYVYNLGTVPISGRTRFMIIGPEQEQQMSVQAYDAMLHQFKGHIFPKNHPYTRLVREVGERIARAAGMNDLDWEFFVVDSPQMNAFVMPGGKVFVFSGILPLMGNKEGVATVLGHEVAHCFARHTGERMSLAFLFTILQGILLFTFGVDLNVSQYLIELFMNLPFSRKHETEADYIGLMLTAAAGYNPRAALEFWQRMERVQGDEGANFLSTHPSHQSRIKKINEWIPLALTIYHRVVHQASSLPIESIARELNTRKI